MGNQVVKERLFLKYLEKVDFVEYYGRACEAPVAAAVVSEEEKLAIASDNIKARLGELTRMAPQVGDLKREYEAKGASTPEAVYGKPSSALVEFAKLFPQYVTLGGCMAP